MRQEELLAARLAEYARSDMYPFHMPGHKRLPGDGEGSAGLSDPYKIDITEIEGFDNLHHPEGILRDSMEWAAGVYGADQTYYLVNGSTAGILSAVCGTVSRGGRILVSRNCHKSVYNGICLNQLKSSYIYPQEIEGLGIQGAVLASDVDKMLKRYMDTQAVLVVSPTYDGIVSDIEAIAQVVHNAGLPLIVDEAHGAHFRYGDMFPASALDLGADVVVQSVHKTMPSLTQTALLHVKCNRPDGGCYGDRERIERYVRMVQSSSPSYVLMASIENSIYQMEHMDMGAYEKRLSLLREQLKGMRHLRLVDTELKGQAGVFDLDRSKIVVSTRGAAVPGAAARPGGAAHSGGAARPGGAAHLGGAALSGGVGDNRAHEAAAACLTGAALDSILRSEYHLEMEMCGADYVTAITTAMDSREGMERLAHALLEIDSRLVSCGEEEEARSVYSMRSDGAMTIGDAMEAPRRKVGLRDCAGCISGEFIYVYPPGIPIVAPGEWISRKALDVILEYIEKGLPVQGPGDQSLETIQAVEIYT